MDNDLILRSFPGLVRDYFGGLIHEYGLKMSVSRMGEKVLLSGNRFSLSVSISTHPGESGSPSLIVHQPGREGVPGYHFGTIMEMRDTQHLARWWGRAGTPSSQLLPLYLAESASDLKKWCPDILAGDFSWVPAYKEFLNEESELLQCVDSLPRDHPVYRAFWEDRNPNWKEIVRQHIAEEEARKRGDDGPRSLLITE